MFSYDVESAEIYLYDDIGPSWLGMIDAGVVLEALSEIGDRRVTVRINSAGGSVDEGVAIFNMLKKHKSGVDVAVDSLAASMGSYIMLAGERRTIAKNARVMIHHPWTIAIGNAAELRKTADVLDKYGMSILPDYAAAMNMDAQEVNALMEAETWYLAEEAIEAGLVHAMDGDSVEPVPIAEGRFKNTPKSLLNRNVAAGSRTPYPVQRERARILAKL